MPDRLLQAPMCLLRQLQGEVLLKCTAEQMKAVVETVSNMGMKVKASGSGMLVEAPEVLKPAGMVRTAPYPGFPTDLQSPLMAASVFAKGETTVEETIFESRFQTAGQLRKMGAEILERKTELSFQERDTCRESAGGGSRAPGRSRAGTCRPWS